MCRKQSCDGRFSICHVVGSRSDPRETREGPLRWLQWEMECMFTWVVGLEAKDEEEVLSPLWSSMQVEKDVSGSQWRWRLLRVEELKVTLTYHVTVI